jgi:hypothetical protein
MELVEAVLRTVPSHGWPTGWTGRRDRALLVLSALAGLSYEQIGGLTAGDLTIGGGVATIRTPGGRTTLRAEENDLLCGPCALARWVHALDLMLVCPDGPVVAAVIARAVPVTADSPHLCECNTSITGTTDRVALLAPIEYWGQPSRMVSPPPLMHRPAERRRQFLPVQQNLHPVTNAPEITGRGHALQRRVEQLLAGSAASTPQPVA